MKSKRLIVLFLALSVLCGCSAPASEPTTPISNSTEPTQSQTVSSEPTAINPSELFSSRDLDGSYMESDCAIISLNGNSASCSSSAINISGSQITISEAGSYLLRGTLNDGCITIDTSKNDKVQLILDQVQITCSNSAAIYIRQADKVFITLAPNTTNALINGGSYADSAEDNIDAVIFSKDDITFNGSGKLSVSSPAGHGIVSKDELTFAGGIYEITSSSHALAGKDSVAITASSFTIDSQKDGIHAENNDDDSLGFIYVKSGFFNIHAAGDGISAAADLMIDGGEYTIVSGGGAQNAERKVSGFPGQMGGDRPGGFHSDNTSDQEEDGISTKAVKSGKSLHINGGTFFVDACDDAFHCNGSITVNNGSYEINTGDDGFHADDTLTINSGTIIIAQSYEGLEGLHIRVNGGNITLTASDDGINAAGGTDSSGFGGFQGKDRFGGGKGGMSQGNGSIDITQGTLNITANGDGIDANGTLLISGGYTVVCGPTRGDTATLDYDKSAVINGGTFIGSGASGMAQTFSDSSQGVISLSVGNQAEATLVQVKDSSGNLLLSHSPSLSFAIIIISSPDIQKGQSYTVYVGDQSGEFEAS